MKKLICIFPMLMYVLVLSAQEGNHAATKTDIEFHNGLWATIQKALPENFHDWYVSMPNRTPMTEDDYVSDCEGSTCWRATDAKITYDGTQTNSEAYSKYQEEGRQLKVTDPKYMQKFGTLLNNFQNANMLEIFVYANFTEAGELSYCKPGGYQKLPPPAGWNSFYSSTAFTTCFSGEETLARDVSIFSMGILPTFTEEKGGKWYRGSLHYALNKTLIGTTKIQNFVLVIKGSKEVALEFIKKVDTNVIKSLLK